jgi:hypothetical protein
MDVNLTKTLGFYSRSSVAINRSSNQGSLLAKLAILIGRAAAAIFANKTAL